MEQLENHVTHLHEDYRQRIAEMMVEGKSIELGVLLETPSTPDVHDTVPPKFATNRLQLFQAHFDSGAFETNQ